MQWKDVSPDTIHPIDLGVISIAIDPDSANVVFIGTGISGYVLVSRDTDNKNCWEITNLKELGWHINSLSINPINTNYLFAAVPFYGVYRTTNKGGTWELKNNGFQYDQPVKVLHNNKKSYEIYSISDSIPKRVYRSTNSGDSWIKLGYLEARYYSTLAITPDGRILYNGDPGIHKFDLTTSVLDEKVKAIEPPISYFNNYPNPFNNETIIVWEATKSGYINLKIFDILGKQVRNLIDKKYSYPGKQNFFWDGKDNNKKALHSGVYIGEINLNDSRKFIKIILTK
ncbi:MAG: T9SS type A sorting domain-containing protein [Ignavibacteria bacterium]|nr:T9SS type A sorting domain-containing protein [Ignavibacteria bacterium]